MTDQRWTLVLKDPDDPYRHSAHAVQRSSNRWDVDYLRGDEVDSTATISTPPPHMPPMATLMGTLQELRTAADYWARRAATDKPHECDDGCVCPVHGTPLFYSPSRGDHACQDADCVHGHGGLTPGVDPAWSEVDRIANEVLADSPRFRQEYEGQWTPPDEPNEGQRP